MLRSQPKHKIPPATTGSYELDVAINTEIALYNRSGNMLALWAVLGICARAGVKLPEGVDKKFETIAERFLEYAKEGRERAREFVADQALGTRNVAGGRSVFQEYALLKRNAGIVAGVFALLMQELKDLQSRRKIRPRGEFRTIRARKSSRSSPPAAKPQSSIYEQVAAEYDVDPATVKRLFEKEEREAGSFAYRALQRKPGPDGITEV